MIKLFGRKKKKQQPVVPEPVEALEKPRTEPVPNVAIEKEKVDINKRESRIAYLEHLSDEIRDAKKQCQDDKFEYGQVTSYLKDIQLIDDATEEEHAVLVEIAEGIYELTKEREKLSSQKYRITPQQKQALDTRESDVHKDMRSLKEHEEYQMKVKNDLRQLTSEKNMLIDEKKEIISRQKMLRTMSKVLLVILMILAATVAVMNQIYIMDIGLTIILMAAFVLVSVGFIVFEAHRNRYDMAMTEKLCNRAIFLSNRVKIKYVNTSNAIQYLCAKYGVKNGVEMEYVVGQYEKMKAEFAKKQEGTKLLNEYNTILLHTLERIGVKDRDVWFYQARALFDSKEMVEVRHNLNVRRQKIRESMDYNTGVLEKSISELEKIRSLSKEYEEDVERVLKDRIG